MVPSLVRQKILQPALLKPLSRHRKGQDEKSSKATKRQQWLAAVSIIDSSSVVSGRIRVLFKVFNSSYLSSLNGLFEGIKVSKVDVIDRGALLMIGWATQCKCRNSIPRLNGSTRRRNFYFWPHSCQMRNGNTSPVFFYIIVQTHKLCFTFLIQNVGIKRTQ